MSLPGGVVLTVGGRNSPFAVSLMLVCVLVGGLGVTGHSQSSTAALLTAVDMRVWYLGLLIGGLIALAGMVWRDPITGMLIERVGQFVLAALMFAHGVALLLLAQWTGFTSAVGVLVFASACSARVIQIHIVARRIRAAVKVIEQATS